MARVTLPRASMSISIASRSVARGVDADAVQALVEDRGLVAPGGVDERRGDAARRQTVPCAITRGGAAPRAGARRAARRRPSAEVGLGARAPSGSRGARVRNSRNAASASPSRPSASAASPT